MIGIASQADFERELARLTNSNQIENKVVDINRGRGNKKEVPSEVRELIASEAIAGSSNKELADTFNVSESSVSAYKHGATSTASYNNPDEKLEDSNKEVRQRIIGPAQTKLLAAIEAITPTKLEEAKVNVASAVARDMASVIKSMSPNNDVNNLTVNQNRVVIYKPRMKEEDEYETIVVNE